MTFNEALKHKKNILKNSSEFTKTLYDYIIIPAIKEEGQKYMDEFRKSPSSFFDESCKTYSSDSQFKVFLFAKNSVQEVL
ncbi:hypothetical protein [Chryseobacterium ginsengisoli]